MVNKKPYCIFTFVKNEMFNLSIWLRYYKQYFKKEDIYIVNHESNDGSIDWLRRFGYNIIDVHNDEIFDHEWLLNTTKRIQRELLEKYEVVVFAEADELIVLNSPFDDSLTDMLEQFRLGDKKVIRVTCFTPIQMKTEEECDSFNILNDRKYWYRDKHMNKPMISKIPLEWEYGYHNARNIIEDANPYILMVHLHKLDYKEAFLKNKRWETMKINQHALDNKLGFQNHIFDENKFKEWFYGPDKLEEIPQFIKDKLKF